MHCMKMVNTIIGLKKEEKKIVIPLIEYFILSDKEKERVFKKDQLIPKKLT